MLVWSKQAAVYQSMYHAGCGTVGKIAKMANVSRPTAKKYLSEMVIDGIVEVHREQYRRNVNAVIYTFVGDEENG